MKPFTCLRIAMVIEWLLFAFGFYPGMKDDAVGGGLPESESNIIPLVFGLWVLGTVGLFSGRRIAVYPWLAAVALKHYFLPRTSDDTWYYLIGETVGWFIIGAVLFLVFAANAARKGHSKSSGNTTSLF